MQKSCKKSKKNIALVLKFSEEPSLEGKCLYITGETKDTYTLEFGEVVFTIPKDDCKEVDKVIKTIPRK